MKLYFFRKDDCDPCIAAKPKVEEIAQRSGAELIVLDLADKANWVKAAYLKVKAAPTLVVTDDGGQRIAGMTGKLINVDRALTILGR